MASDKFLQRLEEKRKAEQEAAKQQQTLADQWKEYIPDVDVNENISPEQKALDDFISLIRITDAYNYWSNKGTVQAPAGQTDSIKVRCPNPAHPDNNPSAWINTEKNVWHCGACSMGGDIWDIAAWYFGFPVPGYKSDPATFRLLREKIGQHFGMTVETGIAGDKYLVQVSQPVPTAQVTEQPAVTTTEPEQQASVTYTPDGAEYEEEKLTREIEKKRLFPGIDWRKIVPANTFLHEYLTATSIDDCPEEYHFWNGLVALGLSVGRLRTLEDSPEVTGNLYVCLTGGSGTGKSKSKRHLTNVLHEALPYKKDDQPPFGARYIKGAQSGEVVIKCFQHEMIDPITNKLIGYWPFIKGFLDFDELGELIGKSSRQGSTLKTTLMELYDGPRYLASTSMSHGTVMTELPYGSVVATTQFKSIRQLITRSDESSGFANRWVFATGIAKEPFSINRVRVDLSQASGYLGHLSLNARAHALVSWTEKADRAWDNFFHKTVQPFRLANDESYITHRIDLLLKKLILLFTVNEDKLSVTEETVSRVAHLYPHLIETYTIIDSEISATEEGDEVDLVIRQIHRMTGSRGPTASEIHKVVKRKITSVGRLRKILENLVILGLIQELKLPPGPKGGRPTTSYIVSIAGGSNVS